MSKLKRKVVITNVRYKETAELTEAQLEVWNSNDEQEQEWLIDELEFELVNDSIKEDSGRPELI